MATNQFLKKEPLSCNALRNHSTCQRYFGYDTCAAQGDWVPKEPIQSLCTRLAAGGKRCTVGSLPHESHMGCVSSPTGIAICRDWFDKVVTEPNS